MRRGLAIAREYGQTLEWWLDLDPGLQALYIAEQNERRRAK